MFSFYRFHFFFFILLVVYCSQGPVQFPRVRDGSAVNGLPYPYEALALKERQQKMGRFAGADSPIVKPAYQALAKHAARLLGKGYNHVDNIDLLNVSIA